MKPMRGRTSDFFEAQRFETRPADAPAFDLLTRERREAAAHRRELWVLLLVVLALSVGVLGGWWAWRDARRAGGGWRALRDATFARLVPPLAAITPSLVLFVGFLGGRSGQPGEVGIFVALAIGTAADVGTGRIDVVELRGDPIEL